MRKAEYALTNRRTKEVYGYLEIDEKGYAIFKLADGVDPRKWNRLGFLGVNVGTRQLENQAIIYRALYSRVPLKSRMSKKNETKRDIVQYISDALKTNSLGVLTDPLAFCA